MITSCEKDLHELPEPEEDLNTAIELARQNLNTPEEKNFFDYHYLSNANQHIQSQITPRDNDALITSVMNHILLQNQEHKFVHGLVERVGYPAWDRSEVINDTTNTKQGVFVPFAKQNSTQLEALLAAVPDVGSQAWKYILVERIWLDSILQTESSFTLSNISFYVAIILEFNKQLFGVSDTNYEEWLSEYNDRHTDGLQGGISLRDCIIDIVITHCIPIPQVLHSKEIEFRGIDRCYFFVVASGDCPPGTTTGGGLGYGGGGSNGGGGGGGNGGEVSPNSAAVNTQLQRCDIIADIQAGDLPRSALTYTTTEANLCGQLTVLIGTIPISTEDLYFWMQAQNNRLFSNVINYIQAHPNLTPLEVAAIQAYLHMAAEGEINMTTTSFLSFLGLYQLVYGDLVPQLELTEEEGKTLLLNSEIANEIKNFLVEKGFDHASKTAGKSLAHLLSENRFEGPYDNIYKSVIDQYGPYFTSETDFEDTYPGNPAWEAIYALECAFVHLQNPTWPDWKVHLTAMWNLVGGVVHTALDICGLIPAGGELCDSANGVLYLIKGDGVNAAFSFSATIPIAGWAATGAKYAGILFTFANKTWKLQYKVSNGLIEFSHKGRLREILGMKNNPAYTDFQAHHIVPEAFWDHPLVQKAAQAGQNPFHMNHANNGVPVPNTRHNGKHPAYSQLIFERFEEFRSTYPNATPDQTANSIQQWLQWLKNEIQNSAAHINDFVPPEIIFVP